MFKSFTQFNVFQSSVSGVDITRNCLESTEFGLFFLDVLENLNFFIEFLLANLLDQFCSMLLHLVSKLLSGLRFLGPFLFLSFFIFDELHAVCSLTRF